MGMGAFGFSLQSTEIRTYSPEQTLYNASTMYQNLTLMYHLPTPIEALRFLFPSGLLTRPPTLNLLT